MSLGVVNGSSVILEAAYKGAQLSSVPPHSSHSHTSAHSRRNSLDKTWPWFLCLGGFHFYSLEGEGIWFFAWHFLVLSFGFGFLFWVGLV